MQGWIILHRAVQDHWIWKDSVKLKWWLDILFTVNYKDATKVLIRSSVYECKRGQCIMSLQNWAMRWGVSKDTARQFLRLLKNENMIDTENIIKTTRITVCNYETYQSCLHESRTKSVRNLATNERKVKKEELIDFDNDIYLVTGIKIKNGSINEKIKPTYLQYLEMRCSIKKNFKSDVALSKNYERLRTLAGKDIPTAIEILDQSIANQYQGIFKIKTR